MDEGVVSRARTVLMKEKQSTKGGRNTFEITRAESAGSAALFNSFAQQHFLQIRFGQKA